MASPALCRAQAALCGLVLNLVGETIDTGIPSAFQTADGTSLRGIGPSGPPTTPVILPKAL